MLARTPVEEIAVVDEAAPLVQDAARPPFRQRVCSILSQTGARGLVGVELGLNSVNAFAFIQAGMYPMLAYPTKYAAAYPYLCLSGLPVCASKLVMDIASAKEVTISWRDHALAVSSINKYVDFMLKAANTDNFLLGMSIAVYVAMDALINHIGSQEVDVSNLVYALGFLLPSAMIGLLHAALEAFKPSWSASASRSANAVRWLHNAVTAAYYAGNLNSFLALMLSFAHISETGDVNPYERLGIFSGALFVSMMLVMAGNQWSSSQGAINFFINAICAASYMSALFNTNSQQQLGELNSNILITGFISLGIVSLLAGAWLKPVSRAEVTPASAEASVATQGLFRSRGTASAPVTNHSASQDVAAAVPSSLLQP